MVTIENILPLAKVEHNAILSTHGDITVAFQVFLPEIFTLSDGNYENIHQIIVKALKVLPNATIFHKQDWYSKAKVKAKFEKNNSSFLSASSERFFNERPYLDHECYIFITKKNTGRKLSSSAYSNILRKSIVPQQTLNPLIFNQFLECIGQFERILQDSGLISLKRLDDDQLAGNANHTGIIEKYVFLQKQDEKTIKDVQLKDQIRIGDATCKLFTLADVDDLPSLCGSRINFDKYSTDRSKYSIGFASPLGQLLSCNHIYNQYIFIEDSQKTIKRLEAKKLRLQSLSTYSRQNAIARDAANDFLNEAISEQRVPIKAHFNILAWSEDEGELRNVKNLVSAAFVQMDAIPKEETNGAPQIWWAGLPGNEADFPMNDTFDTFLEQSTCFLNLESNYRSSISPFGIRLGDRISGFPLHVDISDEPMKLGYTTNRNKFIIGGSGSGKSFYTCHMVRSYYEQGSHIVIVDVGHSYKGLCELLNGYYFTYSEANPIKFNPFYISDEEVLDTEKKESIKNLLLALWKKEDEVHSRSEYIALSNALTLYYKYLEDNTDLFPCFNTFYDFLVEVYLGVLQDGRVKEKDFDIANFLYVLNPYYRGGEFDYLLNATENLDLLNERFVVFEIDAIKDHPILFSVVTLICMQVFISKMRKLKGIRKMILIEEAWKAIAKSGMASSMQYLVKTVRKFFGETVFVTQEIEDIISSPIVKQAIINNSDCKILLDQSKYQNKFDQIQELLGLTDMQKAQVLSMNKANDPKFKYKEVFISLGSYSKVYRTEVSPEEYLAYTTEESEKVKVQEYAVKYGSMKRGISVLAAEMRNRQPAG